MRRAVTVAGIALAAIAGHGAAGASAGSETEHVGVTAREFSLTLSRAAVSPGDGEVEYHNGGEDPHDLQIRRRGTEKVISIGELGPGDTDEADLRLRKGGRYVMWCSTLDGKHRALGMEAELRVKRR
jgi:plastocyanin